MNISSDRYPIDIIIQFFLSIILIPIIIFDINDVLRIIIGLPILLFIPGYMIIFLLFPSKKTKTSGIDYVERFAWSFALSIAIIPIIGIGLNYTPWGLRLTPILLSLELFIFIAGCIAIYRWFQTPSSTRFRFNLHISLPKDKDLLDRLLTIVLIISIFSFMITSAYVIFTPSKNDPFTEFYILNSKGLIDEYPTDLVIGENATVKIGIANHEYTTKTYTVEVWLINQTQKYNKTTDENITVYNHMWYFSKIGTVLDHSSADINEPWKPQWEHDYTFNISRKGNFKMFFLLFTNDSQEYNPNVEYREIANQKINDAYAVINLSISVSNRPKIFNISASPPSTIQNGFVNISCSVFDADGIDNVFLNIRGPKGYRQNVSILDNNTGLVYYSNHTYGLVGGYEYYIWANDTTGNSSRSSTQQFTITDIPIISDVWTSYSSIQQDDFVNISCLVYDFDGVNEIFLNITNPDGIVENFSIIGNNTGYIYYCNRNYTALGDYRYFIWVNDTAGNTNKSDIEQFSVANQLPPNILNASAIPPSIHQGGFVNISCIVYDSDGIDEVYLNIRDPDNISQNFSITHNNTGLIYYFNRPYSVAGNYSYFIWASDSMGYASVSDVKQFTVIFT